MPLRPLATLAALAALASALAACGGSSGTPACDPAAASACGAGLACERVQGGAPACLPELVMRGSVTALPGATAAVSGARVVALDANRAPVSDVAVTSAPGTWQLAVPAARDASGKPVPSQVTLRVDAQGYQAFPSGIRTALPIDLSRAAFDPAAGRWVLSGPLTAVGLVPLGAGAGDAWITGRVAVPPSRAGVLVVAEPSAAGGAPGTGVTGIADRNGDYAVFNLSSGTAYVARPYAVGANFLGATASAGLLPGANPYPDLALALPPPAGARVAGDLIFNNVSPPTTVTLVVESTYSAALDRGEAPPGLGVEGTGAGYSFAGVPDGRYVVLAAFEPDGRTRDLSGVGNTAPVTVSVLNGTGTPSAGFKITGAVDLVAIGGVPVSTTPAVVAAATPSFEWRRQSSYSSAKDFHVAVHDALGDVVWEVTQPSSAGDGCTYAGPALQPGMDYLVRVRALDDATSGVELSRSEDGEAVFRYQP